MSNQLQVDSITGKYTAVGFRNARMAATDGLSPTNASGDRHMLYDREKLLAQSRYFYSNNAIYRGMIDRAVGYIVGTGFGLQMASASTPYNKTVEKLWRDYWVRPEIRGLISGRKVEKMVARELLLCGDTGIIKTDKSLIQMIEAEQIAGKQPNYDGIKKDAMGRPVEYYIARYKRGRVNRSTSKGFQPKHVLFITDPDRPSSTRSVPPAQAAFAMLHRINDVCDSEAIAWQLLSRMAVAITREDAPELGYNESKDDPDKNSAADVGSTSTRLTELDYALMFHANPGEEIKGIDRNLPGKDFPASVRMFLRLLGLPLGMPLEITLLDWTKSNYSQSRAVLQQAYQTFIDWQISLLDYFLTPILEWKMQQWIGSGLVKERKRDQYKHQWIAPTFPWIDQVKEAKAYGMRVDRGFATHGGVLKSLNKDRSDEMDVRVEEVRDAIKRAKKLTEETGETVPWQIFAGLDSKVGAQPTPPTESKENDDEPEGNKDAE